MFSRLPTSIKGWFIDEEFREEYERFWSDRKFTYKCLLLDYFREDSSPFRNY